VTDYEPTPEQRAHIEAIVRSTLTPLIEQVLIKKLGQLVSYAATDLFADRAAELDAQKGEGAVGEVHSGAFDSRYVVLLVPADQCPPGTKLYAHPPQAALRVDVPGVDAAGYRLPGRATRRRQIDAMLPKPATHPKPDENGNDTGPCCAHAYADGWNACRAAVAAKINDAALTAALQPNEGRE
jgi:hypothetical protein